MKKSGYDKSKYGWNKQIEDFVLSENEHVPKGIFTVVVKKGIPYWYFNASKGKSRLTHLCKLDEHDGNKSFGKAVDALKKKFKAPKVEKQTLIDCIEKQIREYRDEAKTRSDNTRVTKKTAQDKISHLNKFKKYVQSNPIQLKDIPKKTFRGYIEDYVNSLRASYSANTVKSHISTLKQFFNELEFLVADDSIEWYNYFDNHFVRTRLRLRRPARSIVKSMFSKDSYMLIVNYCVGMMAMSWRDYALNYKSPDFRKSKYRDHVVQFVSFLQIVYGFRISEVVRCFVSQQSKEENLTGKGGFTYLSEYFTEDGVFDQFEGYIFVCDFKRKQGFVMVDYHMYDSFILEEEISYRERVNNEGVIEYGYNIIDVMKLMFSNDKYLVSMDRTEYYRRFHNSEFGRWVTRFGIDKPHQFRDFMINYNLSVLKRPASEVAAMARNTIAIIDKYYLHESEDLAFDRSQSYDLDATIRAFNEVK